MTTPSDSNDGANKCDDADDPCLVARSAGNNNNGMLDLLIVKLTLPGVSTTNDISEFGADVVIPASTAQEPITLKMTCASGHLYYGITEITTSTLSYPVLSTTRNG